MPNLKSIQEILDEYDGNQETKVIKKTRKAFSCERCGSTIEKGSSCTVYTVARGTDYSAVRICTKCKPTEGA